MSTKQSSIARNMFQALKNRISQKHKEKLSGVLQYLYNPHDNEDPFQLFPLPDQTIIRKQLKNIIERLSDENYCTDTDINQESEYEIPRETDVNFKRKISTTNRKKHGSNEIRNSKIK